MFDIRDFKLPINGTLFKQISLGNALRLDAWIPGHNPAVRVIKHHIRLSDKMIIIEDINTLGYQKLDFEELQ